ncbi:MAG: glycosyl hydrolase family 18 protein [Firmicutes bacterium]|nr:glycosyl hydrolase family 18 protein [Bacillota bacterium]
MVDSKFEKEVLDFAHSRNIKVVALFNNKKYPEGDNGAFLRNEADRKKVIDRILAVLDQNGYDGVNVDFELLKPDLKEALTDFVDKLSAALHGKNKLLAVSVFPQVDVSPEISGVYDYASLAKAADYLVLMAYDKHHEQSPPGPVAPLKWTEDNVSHALKFMPANKLALAIGSYGYDWPPGGKGEYIPASEALRRAQQAAADVQWDEDSQQAFFTYSVGGEKHQVWFQNAASVRQKIDLAKKKRLLAIALWRLGFEEPEVWNIIKSDLRK